MKSENGSSARFLNPRFPTKHGPEDNSSNFITGTLPEHSASSVQIQELQLFLVP